MEEKDGDEKLMGKSRREQNGEEEKQDGEINGEVMIRKRNGRNQEVLVGEKQVKHRREERERQGRKKLEQSRRHEKNKQEHKQKKWRNDSNSRSRSRSRQKKSTPSSPPQKQKSDNRSTKLKPKINSNFLSTLIINQKLTNKKLDEEDLDKTTEKLKKNFNETRRSVTMSQYLSNESLRIKPIQNANKCYSCSVGQCKKEFETLEEFQKHIQKHREFI